MPPLNDTHAYAHGQRVRYRLILFVFGVALFSAGAQAASYSYDDTVAFAWETASTDVVWENSDTSYNGDDDQQLVNIGFTFNFGGVDYTQLRIITNGALHFGANQGFHKDFSNEALPITNVTAGPGYEEPADRAILAYWDDLNPSSGGTVRYSTLGSAPDRRFVASWEGVPRFPGAGSYTFQAILYENGDIKLQYGGGDTDGNPATIGVEVDDSDYTQYSFNSSTVTNGDAILFRPSRHYAISHGGSGDLCNAENVTITRHYGSHLADTSGYTGTITLSTSTGNGTWSLVTGSGALTDLGGGSATYAFAAADAGQVVLGLLDSVAETVNINITDGAGSEDAGEDANLVFSNTVTQTFRDEFNAVSYAGNNGTQNWTGNWVEFNDDGSASGADEQVVSDGGSNRLRVQDNDGGGEGVYREADLSGFDASATAMLTFDYRRNALDDANDYVAIQVSADGGGAWTELARFAGPTNDAAYQGASYDITGYMASNTRIRFISSANLGGGDRVYFDNVQIAVDWATSCAGADHFDIDHDGLGISCLPETITVTAELADGTSDTAYTGTITLDTQSGNGTWTLNTGTPANFTDPTPNDGLATYTFDAADNGVAIFNLDYQSGTAIIDVDVYAGATRDDDLEGNLVFSPSGFTVTSAALSNPPPGVIDTTIPAQTAATNFTLYLAAYGQTAADPACGIIESYTGAQNINFWSNYNNPASGTLAVAVDGGNVAANEGASAAQSVSFTNGQAAITVNYPDAGQITLAMKDGATGNPDLPTGIRGASNAFVVKPAGFILSNIIRSSDSVANPGTAVNESGAVFMAAGDNFSVTVTARNSLGNPTPNYGQETPAESVLLTPAITAAGGANNPAIAFTTGFNGLFANGAATGVDFNWPEVGIITLTPSVGDGSYLGAGDVTGSASGNVGRFYPADFEITASAGHDFATQCGSFTYMGQGFGYNSAPGVTVTARAEGGATTTNYDGAWWKLGDFSESYSHSGGIPATASLDAGAAGHVALSCVNCDGAGTATFNGNFTYNTTSPETIPFAGAVDIGFTLPADSDGVCYNGTANPCNTNNGDAAQAFSIAGVGFNNGAEQRSGRGYAYDAHGTYAAIGDVLTLPVGTEYYAGAATGWVANAVDNCTSYTYTQADSGITAGITPVSPVALVNGVNNLAVQLTGDAGDPGGVTTVTFTWASWLNGVTSATATFGIFRGDDRFLYWREGP